MSAGKQVEPEIGLTAFSCPHCQAFAKQDWRTAYVREVEGDGRARIVARDLSNVSLDQVKPELRASFEQWAKRSAKGVPFLGEDRIDPYVNHLHNIHVSSCFNCQEIAIWLYDRMLWPVRGNAPPANPDIPPEIRADYEEAASIADLSPRGATALLRLVVQKLCLELGGDGKNINDDIASLVSKGLDKRVQQALDIVRVVGNNAVHPGQLDLKDDRATAAKLFALVNLIAEIMISQPKHVSTMFDSLPAGAKDAIKKRDGGP